MYIDACARNVRVSKNFFAILILQVYVGIYVCMYACMYICIYMQARHESVTKNFFSTLFHYHYLYGCICAQCACQ